MRIDRLDLSRYGKFADQPIALPVAKHDFHLIVGANEAGKSTIRNAILDLLFGIERSAEQFVARIRQDVCPVRLRVHGRFVPSTGCSADKRCRFPIPPICAESWSHRVRR